MFAHRVTEGSCALSRRSLQFVGAMARCAKLTIRTRLA
jgi:hypothetical protein